MRARLKNEPCKKVSDPILGFCLWILNMRSYPQCYNFLFKICITSTCFSVWWWCFFSLLLVTLLYSWPSWTHLHKKWIFTKLIHAISFVSFFRQRTSIKCRLLHFTFCCLNCNFSKITSIVLFINSVLSNPAKSFLALSNVESYQVLLNAIKSGWILSDLVKSGQIL